MKYRGSGTTALGPTVIDPTPGKGLGLPFSSPNVDALRISGEVPSPMAPKDRVPIMNVLLPLYNAVTSTGLNRESSKTRRSDPRRVPGDSRGVTGRVSQQAAESCVRYIRQRKNCRIERDGGIVVSEMRWLAQAGANHVY
jgi:hypothetical protein